MCIGQVKYKLKSATPKGWVTVCRTLGFKIVEDLVNQEDSQQMRFYL